MCGWKISFKIVLEKHDRSLPPAPGNGEHMLGDHDACVGVELKCAEKDSNKKSWGAKVHPVPLSKCYIRNVRWSSGGGGGWRSAMSGMHK